MKYRNFHHVCPKYTVNDVYVTIKIKRLVERVSGHKNMYGESEMLIDLSQNEVQVIILTV